jgi:hypothetical protein
MKHPNTDPEYTPEEIEDQDPLGERAFEEAGFEDAADGSPQLEAEGTETPRERHPGRQPQKVAGIPKEAQHESTSPSLDRPDTQGGVRRERGGAGKGDPAVGGTRPD